MTWHVIYSSFIVVSLPWALKRTYSRYVRDGRILVSISFHYIVYLVCACIAQALVRTPAVRSFRCSPERIVSETELHLAD